MLDLGRDFLARARLVAPRTPVARPTGATRLTGVFTPATLPPEVRAALSSAPVAPYQGLSAFWHEHWASEVALYGAYAGALQRGGRVGRAVALDLACGTGLVAADLAPHFARVYALDASPNMLAEARRRLAAAPHVTCLAGTFEAFAVPERVDLVVCAGNSLNYLRSLEALTEALRQVRRALVPGGRFLFDLQSPASFAAVAGQVFRYRHRDHEWYQGFAWDRATKLDEAWTWTPAGLERHPRRSFTREEVRLAARAAGLEPTGRFEAWPLRRLQRLRTWDFHELRRPSAAAATSPPASPPRW